MLILSKILDTNFLKKEKMKNIIYKLAFIFIASGILISCEENDIPTIDDNVELVQFSQSSFNVTVPSDESTTVTVPVNVTNISNQDRTFPATVVESSTAVDGSFSIGTVTVPAGSYTGEVDVTLSPDNLEDGESYTLVFSLPPFADGSSTDQATITFNKQIICNDFLLTIVTDQYAEETSWDIRDSSGEVVVSGPETPYGPAGSVESRGKTYETDIFLEDGCYTFTIYDAYSDGQFDGTFEGSYNLSCSILEVASGSGAFGAQEATEFCVNQ